MKQKIVPTSPKAKEAVEVKKSRWAHSKYIFIVFVFSIILGAFAGFSGFIIATSIPGDWPLLGDLNVISLLEKQRENVLLSTRRFEGSIVSQSPRVIDQIVALYSAEPTIDAPVAFLGNAVVLTSDGWMVAPASLVEQSPVVVFADGSIEQIGQKIPDPLTGMIFFRVNKINLPIVTFTAARTIPVGQLFSVIEKQLGSFVVYERRAAGEVYRTNTIRSTTAMNEMTLLDKGAELASGLPVFSSGGEFVGIMVDGGKVVHSALIHGALESIMTDSSLEPSLERFSGNIQYINIARLSNYEKQSRQLPPSGVYIVNVDDTITSLRAGDVLIAINNDYLDENDDLSTILHARSKGAIFIITIQRDNKEEIIEFKM